MRRLKDKIPDPSTVKITESRSLITITIGPDLQCPRCGALEVVDTTLPVGEWKWNIRPNKVEIDGKWWSQCLVCKAAGREDWF